MTDGGQRRAVDSLAPLSRPWRIVVYVDRVLTGSRTLRASAGTLAEQAAALSKLGTVEVVVAEPDARIALGRTREIGAIDEALSKLWLENDGRDDVRVLRQRFREEKRRGASIRPTGPRRRSRPRRGWSAASRTPSSSGWPPRAERGPGWSSW